MDAGDTPKKHEQLRKGRGPRPAPTAKRNLELDSDVQSVAELIQSHVLAAKLVAVADALLGVTSAARRLCHVNLALTHLLPFRKHKTTPHDRGGTCVLVVVLGRHRIASVAGVLVSAVLAPIDARVGTGRAGLVDGFESHPMTDPDVGPRFVERHITASLCGAGWPLT